MRIFNKRYNQLFKITLALLIMAAIPLCLGANIFPAKTVELEYNTAEIILPDGRTIKENIAVKDDMLFIPYEALEVITNETVSWDPEDQTLTIGNLSLSKAMSDTLKVYHYDYDANHAFLYAPDIRTNKPMTMGDIAHDLGYSFSNVQSASFNLDGHYHHLIGLLGCEDFKAANGTITVYLDNEIIASYDIASDGLPTKVDLNLTGGNQLKFVFSKFLPNSQVDLADAYIEQQKSLM